MVAITVQRFDGMEPIVAPRLLAPTSATAAVNANLLDGTLRGIHQPQHVRDIISATINYQASYKIIWLDKEKGIQGAWADFPHPYTDFIKGPLINDKYERFYWTAPGEAVQPRFNTAERIAKELPPTLLGVPKPPPHTVSTTAGTDTTQAPVTRVYVTTYVNTYGEEGPPSEPVAVRARPYDHWGVHMPPVEWSPAEVADRAVTGRRVYRTVFTPAGQTQYWRVADLPLDTLTFVDTQPDLVIAGAGGSTMVSSTNTQPPPNLDGLILMPDGFFAGFVGRDIYFSEKYRPHAWPPQYAISVEHPIVGLGVFGNTCVVLTKGSPVGLTGSSPANMSMTKTGVAEPCRSRGSIVSSPEGVYYASHNGLVLVNGSGVQNITQSLISKQEWITRYRPDEIRAARYKTQYIGINDLGKGFIINLGDERVALSEFTSLLSGQNLLNDPWTGEVHLIGRNKIFLWDPEYASPVPALWRSKEFVMPKPVNFGVMSISFGLVSAPGAPILLGSFENEPGVLTGTVTDPDIEVPLVFPTPPDSPRPPDLRPSFPMIMPAMTEMVRLREDRSCRVRIWAARELVFDHEFTAPQEVRLPSGFKSDTWQFEVISRVPVMSVTLGETTKDLRNV